MNTHFMQKKIVNNPIIAMLLMFTIFFSMLVFFYSVYQQRDVVHDRAILVNEQAIRVKIQKNLITKEFEEIVSDMFFLNKSPIFKKFVNGKTEKSPVENEWIAFSESRKKYDQLRYIDNIGNEIIRVNFNNGKVAEVDDSLLQNKKDRYYFIETLKLDNKGMYISKFDLNIEGTEIEIPIKPMIRFGLPVFDQANNKQGILIANYFGRFMLDEVKKTNNKNNAYMQLVNADSYWLVGIDEASEWAFMYQDKKNQNFKNDFPEEWSRIVKERNGQFFSVNGLFAFQTISIGDKLQKSLGAKSDSGINVESNDPVWFIISQIPSNTANYVNDKNPYIVAGWTIFQTPLLLFSMIVISLFLSVLLVLHFLENEKIIKLATYDTMTGCLNRASGIMAMENMIKKHIDITVCFVDVNGLKEVNDFLGHANGDDLILSSVKAMQENIRDIDLLIRLGGDEFLICFPNIEPEQAEIIWQRIVEETQQINKNGDKPFLISLSHGVANLKNLRNYTLDSVIMEADLKMYEEKKSIKDDKFSVIKQKKKII